MKRSMKSKALLKTRLIQRLRLDKKITNSLKNGKKERIKD